MEALSKTLAKVSCLLFLLVIDIIWVTSTRSMYANTVKKIQGSSMQLNQTAAVIAYLFVGIAFIGIVVPSLEKCNDFATAAWTGALAGIVIYGIFNATNKAMFSNYDTVTAIIDTMWGTTLFAVTSMLYVGMRRGS